MPFNIDEFKVYNSKAGNVKASSFIMTIGSVPNGLKTGDTFDSEFASTLRDHGFAVEAANVPGIKLATDEVRRYGIGPLEQKVYVPIFGDLNIRVRCDAEGKLYNFFQSWLKLIFNFDMRNSFNGSTGIMNGQGVYELAYKKDYAVDVDITSFNNDGNSAISIKLLEAYPIFIGDIDMDWANVNSFVKIPITLTFRDWYQKNNITSNTNTARPSTTDSKVTSG